jgi:putative ABC transport system ATP-binding protein
MLTLVAETNTALMVVTHSRNVAARMDKQLRLIGGRLK